MAFVVPSSSSPPSTPGGQTPQYGNKFSFSSLNNHPSTTPAGPPPSSAHSFTPAGPPPSSIFGSSQPGTGVSKLRFSQGPDDRSLFGSSAVSSAPKPSRGLRGTPRAPLSSNTFQIPGTSPYSSPGKTFGQSGFSTVPEGDGEDEEEDLDVMGEEESDAGIPSFKGFTTINNKSGLQGGASMPGRSTYGAASKSRQGASARKSQRSRKPSALPGSGKASVIPGIARDLAARSKDASLFESDDMIIATEELVSEAYEAVQQRGLLPEVRQDILSRASTACLRIWSKHADAYTDGGLVGSDGLGPGESASPISKGTFLSSLLLSLHHPPLQHIRQTPWNAPARSLAIVPVSTPKPAPMPQVLLEWLDKYHISVEGALNVVRTSEPNCTAHELFWETVLGLLIRGKLKEVILLFNEADFRHADTALDDGEDQPGYRGAQLQSVQGVVGRARQILEASPAVRHGDWHVNNSDWSIFRKRVESELGYLAEAAEGANKDDDDDEDSFEAENFGVRNGTKSFSETARRAQSNVPWTIYENLKIFYNILLGSSAEIIAQSQDWLEASLALTVWWDGTEDDNIASWSLSVSRQSARSTKASLSEDPYLSRLSAAFLSVTDSEVPDSFQINTMSQLEVGLASVLQGNIEGVLGSLRSWSLVIASALAEIGAMGGWILPTAQSNSAGLDEDDLMVLSYGQEQKAISKDDILQRYAEALFEKEEMEYQGEVREGWELAIPIATRLDDQNLAKDTISQLLDELHLVSQDRMDKLVMLCTDLGLEEQARNVSERFADHLIGTTTLYGPAMICFARAHATNKLRTLISLLVSYSLVSSVAYPLESELDPSLAALLHNPKSTLSNIADIDEEAAALLQFHLTGYASLRRFYSLRDAELLPNSNRTPNLRPLARTRLGAKYLIAVINSAADPIYGGLYDAQRESAIQVDGLLTLLGEAAALLSQHQPNGKHILTKQQIYDLLRAIEDLETVNERVYAACEECFKATIRNASSGNIANNNGNGSSSSNNHRPPTTARPPNPMDMLKKSVSSGSGSNFSFSMIGSEMLNSNSNAGSNSGGNSNSSIGGSAVLIPSVSGSGSGSGSGSKDVPRAWDWRKIFLDSSNGDDQARNNDRPAGHVKGTYLLKSLRRGLARELAWALLRG